MARRYGVHLHTHLAETQDEEAFCLEKFGHRPVGYMQSLGWVGEDVWFAHSVHINQARIDVLAHEGCGVAHCPGSNMRLPPVSLPFGNTCRLVCGWDWAWMDRPVMTVQT
jgi:8-oxoguanine deaminase